MQDTAAFFDVGALETRDDRDRYSEVFRSRHHAVGDHIAADDAAKNIDKHGFNFIVGKQDLERLFDALMVLLVTASLTFAYALGSGNAGSAYRYRAQVLAFYLIFAAVGREVARRPGGYAPPYTARVPPRPGALGPPRGV